MINRLKVQEVLEKIDSEYKKLANAVLAIAAQELKDVFGYQLVTGQELIGMKDGKKDEYFLLNTSGSKRLRTLLAQADKSGAYFGFMTVVLFSVLMAPSERVSCANLLTNVRKVDPRFPLHIATSKNAHSATALAIPELGDDFLGLLNRMKKVRVSLWFDDVTSVSSQPTAIPAALSCCYGLRWCSHSTLWSTSTFGTSVSSTAIFSNPKAGVQLYSPTLCPQEQYLNSAKDDVDTAEVSKVIYSFGPRFYAEVRRTSFCGLAVCGRQNCVPETAVKHQ
jgi:hypothetical protein